MMHKYISKTRQSCRPSSWCLKPTKQQTEKNAQTHLRASFPFSHSLIGCSLKNDQKKLQSYSPEKMLEADAEIKIELQVSMIFLCCHFPLPISMRFAACGPYIQLRDFFIFCSFPFLPVLSTASVGKLRVQHKDKPLSSALILFSSQLAACRKQHCRLYLIALANQLFQLKNRSWM